MNKFLNIGSLKSVLARRVVFSAGVLAAAALAAPAAWAVPCATAPVATYTAAGFSCSVGPVTFSDIDVTPTIANGGSVTLTSFNPFTTTVGGATEYGLQLIYSSNTGTSASGTADVAWTYNVTGTPDLEDAYMSFTGTTTGTGSDTLSETLSNGVTLALNAPGATSATFTPIGMLSVIKDQDDFAGPAGSAQSSVMTNAFSTTSTPVPEPASLALFGTALVGLGLVGRRRRGNTA